MLQLASQLLMAENRRLYRVPCRRKCIGCAGVEAPWGGFVRFQRSPGNLIELQSELQFQHFNLVFGQEGQSSSQSLIE